MTHISSTVSGELAEERSSLDALGYLGFGGDLDMAITLHTVVVAGGVAHVQTGAGLVADSDPVFESGETLRKAQAMVTVVEQAEAMR